jgi:pyruvate dehydrogenase E2 component (dihydrolipoamide acetyltransferase)
MPTNVVMPQMGESVTEGTVVRWIKRVGDPVDRDEPLFEISTDKVDAEIPSPAAGVLATIAVREGETVPVNTVVAVIEEREPAAASQPETARRVEPPPLPVIESTPSVPPLAAPTPVAQADASAEPERATAPDGHRQRSSPLVRRIAREHEIDIRAISGTGIGGRVTKADILAYLARPATEARESAARPEAVSTVQPPDLVVPAGFATGQPARPVVSGARPGERVEVVPLSLMRRKIGERMVQSRRTSAHVHSVFEVDFSAVEAIRAAKKAEYERLGAKLTYMPFIVKATVGALRAMPVLNASIDGDNIVYKHDINIGIAVALEWGLIVPVIRNADEKNVLGLTRAIADLAERARTKQLRPDEVQGGTFTITNPGALGALFGMPIINQPQVAILDVGAVEKRPVVIDDGIAIRPRAYLSLGFDHRLIDGAVADQFMSILKKHIEDFDADGL